MYLGWLQKLTHALDAKPNKMEVLTIMREESVCYGLRFHN